jgi:hypothetical protein
MSTNLRKLAALTWFDDIAFDTLQEAIDLVDDYAADHTW